MVQLSPSCLKVEGMILPSSGYCVIAPLAEKGLQWLWHCLHKCLQQKYQMSAGNFCVAYFNR